MNILDQVIRALAARRIRRRRIRARLNAEWLDRRAREYTDYADHCRREAGYQRLLAAREDR